MTTPHHLLSSSILITDSFLAALLHLQEQVPIIVKSQFQASILADIKTQMELVHRMCVGDSFFYFLERVPHEIIGIESHMNSLSVRKNEL